MKAKGKVGFKAMIMIMNELLVLFASMKKSVV